MSSHQNGKNHFVFISLSRHHQRNQSSTQNVFLGDFPRSGILFVLVLNLSASEALNMNEDGHSSCAPRFKFSQC